MYSRSPSRNQRSKGFKVKRILQICLLVAVFFWLVYQVKRSHEKNKEFDEKDSNLVSDTQNDSDILKLGRKDISRVRETVTDDKLHGEDKEEYEEENWHAEGEQEREESRTEELEEEDTGKGGEDDEIDKHEEEKIDDENHEEEDENHEEKIDDENHEEIADEENGREEGDEKSENDDVSEKEANEESETVLEDQDGEVKNTHEAREEHYKADDASSELAHDTKTIIPKSELIIDGKENASQNSNESLLEENSGLEMKEREGIEGVNSSYSIITAGNEFSSENSTTPRELNDKYQASTNLTRLDSEHSANVIQAQNATYESDLASDKNQLGSKNDMNDTHIENIRKLVLAENITGVMETKADVVNLTNASVDKDMDSDLENVAAEESGSEVSISDTENENDNLGVDFHDPVDDPDSITQQENEYRTDLGTLPDIQVEVQNPDEVEAE